MRLEDMPVEIMFTRWCRCENISRDTDQHAPCPKCGQKDQFRKFQTEPLAWAMDRARRRLAAFLSHESQSVEKEQQEASR